jgi:hypothetical protein
MRVDVSMSTEKDEFSVSSWWAKSPEFVVRSLQSQLEAAQAIWPDLRKYQLAQRRERKRTPQ